MAELSILENNYPMSYREAFETVATHMFCVMLGLTYGVNRPVGKKGMESYHVQVGSRLYAFQAKYYDPATKLRNKKAEFISSIKEARKKGITDLIFFVNKDHTGDSKTGEKAAYLREIETAAQGESEKPIVTLDWWTLSRIEQTLDMPEYRYIRDLYLGEGTCHRGVYSFYTHIYNECIDNSDSELYGGMSLLDSYIEPTLETNDKSDISVRSYLESWVEGKAPITVICGEPGHGKTSLCYKAMCDFYKNKWLDGKVLNVFCFSLNPANTDALTNGSLNIYDLLSWGDDRKNQKINKEACREALIFFDGFDELKEWYPGIDLGALVKNHIVPFQKSTNAHIAITSRTMAVEPEKSGYTLRNGMHIPINKLQPISKEQQYEWIAKYIKYVRDSYPRESEEIERYFINYQKQFDNPLTDDDSLKELMGIPIILRMTVTARYLPQTGQGVMEIYNDLFDLTWERHRRQDNKDRLTVKTKLAEHALQIFIDDNLTAETDMSGNEPWIFSFYTTHEGKRRVGFLHRSLYQYFLAYEILSWYEKYTNDKNIDEFRNSLSYLSRRQIDKTSLIFIKELYEQVDNKEAIGAAIFESYKILKTTDGILPLPTNSADSEKINLLSPLLRANNVFGNIISIGSTCETPLSEDCINEVDLIIYDLAGSILIKAQLHEGSLIGAKLKETDLRWADLSAADIKDADLKNSDLRWADLSRANLRKSDLSGADLSGAKLSGAKLSEADLRGADLSGADLSGADLSGADLRRADLTKTDFRGADLTKTNFRGSDLSEIYLIGVDLREADLRGADLSRANLSGAKLISADFSESNLSWANLSRANLSRANLRRVDLRWADLRWAGLSGADFRCAGLIMANLSGANLRGAKIEYAEMLSANVKEVRITWEEYEYVRQQKVENIDTVIIETENE